MKKSIIAVFLLTGLFSSNAALMVPAEPVHANINEHFVVTLPADQPLAPVYVVDISSFNFKSQEQLSKFCESACERVIMFRANFEEKKMYISPQPTMTEGTWTILDWNSYLSNRAVKLEALYQTIMAG